MYDRCSSDVRQMFDRHALDYRCFSIDTREMTLDARSMFVGCEVGCRQVSVGLSLDFRYMFDRCYFGCSLDVRWILVGRSLDVCSMFVGCEIGCRPMVVGLSSDIR